MANNFKPALGFNFLTPVYDQIMEFFGYGQKLNNCLLKIIPLSGKENILDIGCGTGSLLERIKTKYPKTNLTGLDPDQKVLKTAKNKFEKSKLDIELVKGFSQKLPFENEKFDIVFNNLTFHHLSETEKEKTIKEIYRVLKPNGKFILTDFGPNKNKIVNFFLTIALLLDNVKNDKYILEDINWKLLKENNFEVKEIIPRYKSLYFLIATKITDHIIHSQI